MRARWRLFWQWVAEMRAQWKTYRSGAHARTYRTRYTRTTVYYADCGGRLTPEAEAQIERMFQKAKEAFDEADKVFEAVHTGTKRPTEKEQEAAHE